MDPSLQFWIFIIILIIIQLSLMIYGVLDWNKQPETLSNRNIWLLIIVFVGMIGPVLYFLMAPRNLVTQSTENEVWE